MLALDAIHAEKYRDPGQSREQHTYQLASNLASNKAHKEDLVQILGGDYFLPAGRVQAAGGSSRNSSYFNCAVSGTIDDSMESIGTRLKESLLTLRLGTGIGYDFSNLRPKGALIKTLNSASSGPLSFMEVFDAGAKTIHMSHRRGAQMAVMRVDHPDIREFIQAKRTNRLTTFNLSVGVTDEFMEAVHSDTYFSLRHYDAYYANVHARTLWDEILLTAYETAEPGILFLDHINNNNNLHYCEIIAATNPCAEQPLPPFGMCLLGSFNLTKYLNLKKNWQWHQFELDIRNVVEAYDNIFERSIYALDEHRIEAQSKRRIGLGLTGIANAIEFKLGKPCYGDADFNAEFAEIASFFRNTVYRASIDLARERQPFDRFGPRFNDSRFIRTLPDDLRKDISKYGIRNSHLISYAPTGTISLAHGNISSGVEPVFYPHTKRTVILEAGPTEITIPDHNVARHNLLGRTLEHCTTENHLDVHTIAQRYCDSAISKTINMPAHTSFTEYKDVWSEAHKRGIKGLTVYRPNDIRPPIIKSGDCENGQCVLPLAA